jgi:hypothetical protein
VKVDNGKKIEGEKKKKEEKEKETVVTRQDTK